jgi:hypothetical protein
MVVDDLGQAAAGVAAGGAMVLLVDPDVHAAVRWPDGPGRMAVLVGRADDAAATAAAAAMDRELFGRTGR